MSRRRTFKGTLWGGLTSAGVIGLTYLGHRGAGLPFVPFDVFDWLARVLPGSIINLTIDGMVKVITALKIGPTWAVAKGVEQSLALALLVGAGLVLGAVLGGLAGRPGRNLPVWGAAGGLALLGPALAAEVKVGFPPAGPLLSVLWLTVVFLGWGTLLGRLIQVLASGRREAPSAERRRFLWIAGLGSFAVGVSALGVRLLSGTRAVEDAAAPDVPESLLAQLALTSGPAASPPLRELEARPAPAPGTRPEITANDKFYRIDIDTRPPRVDASEWRLEVVGLVEKPLRLTLAEIAAMPAQRQALTLSCISNPVGGDLISTGIWTGVRLKDVLAQAGLRPQVRAINVAAVDGFYESIPLAEALDDRTLLVYAMNGDPLPPAHGFPLRVYIPGHYGMKQPKWIVRLEAADREGPGYWVDRGWDRKAVPRTTSVIDAIAVRAARADVIPVGGIAYSGDRGISQVELRVDDGPWQTAVLRTPPLSPLTWVEWRFDWRAPRRGRHVLRVRARDGRGVLQDPADHDTFPAGATGIFSKSAET
jgi:DMSO/TMAO reductase YedYZ molybdopterin-dependent catalytic subunit